jgi:N6-adenosine-specific RNA methylase IME4
LFINIKEKYNIIYADPPWQYRTSCDKNPRGPELHYPTMHTADICALPVKDITADNSILFLWATFPKLPDALEVIKAWGFLFKTVGFVWIKKNRKADSLFMGMGMWTRSNAEICLIAVKGKPQRIDCGVHQVIISPIEEHSKKPDEIRARILQLVGDLPRVELFARQTPPGWSVWGNEVDCTITL